MILAESRTLFARLAPQTDYVLSEMAGSPWCDGLVSVTKLGDVFHYDPSKPDRIKVRVDNSHFDTYFVTLVKPNSPEPSGFERIAGNVGFIEPGTAPNAASKHR